MADTSYMISYAHMRALRDLAETTAERDAVRRLYDGRGDERDVETAVSLYHYAGEDANADALLSTLDERHTPDAARCPYCGDSPCACGCCERCGRMAQLEVGLLVLCRRCADELEDEAYDRAPSEYDPSWGLR